MVQYYAVIHTTLRVKHRSDFELTKYIAFLTLMDNLCGVCYKYFRETSPWYNTKTAKPCADFVTPAVFVMTVCAKWVALSVMLKLSLTVHWWQLNKAAMFGAVMAFMEH